MKKIYDVASVCNALVDVLVDVDEAFIQKLGLRKGTMHLVETKTQMEVLQLLKDHTLFTELGGSSLNAIRALAALKMKTFFSGCVAKDKFGSLISERMKYLQIEHSLGHSAAEATGTCLILITPDGERTMLTHLGASRLYTDVQIPTEKIQQAKIFHFCGYQWDTPQQKLAIRKALEAAKKSRTLISFDVADPFVVEKNRDDFMEIIENYADIVFANKAEIALLLPELSPEEAAREIAENEILTVIKLGAEGAIVADENQLYDILPCKTTVVDTTAAGDMFAGGFLYGYLKNLGPQKSGEIAAQLASDVISRVGARLSDAVIAEIL